jgi:putative peptidoglycan lipid II flippase
VMPATVALMVLAGPLTVAIFHYGQFDAQDVRMSALAVTAFASGLMGFSLVKVLAPGFFARQDTRTPMRIGIRALAVNMGLNLFLVLPMAFHSKQPGLHAFLALNIGISAWYNAFMLYRGLRREHVLHHVPGWRPMLLQVAAGNVLMGLFLWYVAGSTERWMAMHTIQRLEWMSVLVIGGAAIYFGVLFVLGMRVSHLRVRSVGPIPSRNV